MTRPIWEQRCTERNERQSKQRIGTEQSKLALSKGRSGSPRRKRQLYALSVAVPVRHTALNPWYTMPVA